MICRFPGNDWPDPGFDTIVLLPNAFIRIWSSGGRQKDRKSFLFLPLTFKKLHIWGMTGKTGSESAS